MKILHTVEYYAPSVGGTQEVTGQLSRRLALMGHDVTVATTKLPKRSSQNIDGVKIQEFSIAGNPVAGYTGKIALYEKFLLESEFDIVTNFAAQQWATDIALPLLPQITAKKVFVPTGMNGLIRPQFTSYYENVKSWMHGYDANVFLSNDYRDIDFARKNGIERRIVIPNGAGADEFNTPTHSDIRTQLGIPKTDLLILHVGSHTGHKGHSEAIQIFKKARVQNATLVIVGNDFGNGCAFSCKVKRKVFGLSPGSSKKRLMVVDLPRPETLAAYQAADLFLFPSNIECSPLVLFECMASQTPFLTSDVGNAREIIEWSGGGKLLQTTPLPEALSTVDITAAARALEDLVNAPALRQDLAQSGHSAWCEKFTWEHITRQYENLYQSLLDNVWPPLNMEFCDSNLKQALPVHEDNHKTTLKSE